MIVRGARVQDAQAIADIQNPIIRDTAITFNSVEKTAEAVREAIAECPCFLVAEQSTAVLGYVSYQPFRAGVGYARTMEHAIALAPQARGQGAGRMLMTAAEDHARAAGIGSFFAGISGENEDGITFHARMGYEHAARLPKVGFKFGRWMDLVLMRKWLLEPDETG
ncbi:MAG: N-acetyltransferase family protein [Pseudomonadota bacterium]